MSSQSLHHPSDLKAFLSQSANHLSQALPSLSIPPRLLKSSQDTLKDVPLPVHGPAAFSGLPHCLEPRPTGSLQTTGLL